jgi:hypothetical protein
MKLIFIYGPPAVGKFTVARALAARTGWPLFHNHLTVDLVLSVYPFGSPGFVALREEIWLATFRRAMADGLPGLIFTFNPENSVPQRFIDGLWAELAARGTEIFTVSLTASEEELERRLAEPGRREHRKLVDLSLYRSLRAAGTFDAPLIPGTPLRIDTGAIAPGEAAEAIAAAVHRSGPLPASTP